MSSKRTRVPAFPFDAILESVQSVLPHRVAILVGLPPLELSPNRSPHFSVKARATKEYRAACAWHTKKQMLDEGIAKFRMMMISARFVLIDGCMIANQKKTYQSTGPAKTVPVYYRPQDSMNGLSSLKAAQDGIVDAGLIANDSRLQVMQGPVIIERMSKAHAASRGYHVSCVEMICQGILE